MANYQEELAKALVLARVLPLIISSGRNSASQAATSMVRARALGETTFAASSLRSAGACANP
jgi:Mg/Co/Ni transporter MgtE